MRLSLDQMLAIHKAEGKRPLLWLPKDGGEFEVECIDVPSGNRLWREVHHNLMTKWLHNAMWYGGYFVGSLGHVFVSNDEKPVNVRKEVIRATYATTVPMSVQCSAFTANVPSRTWTFTGTIPAPASGKVRYYRTVGIGGQVSYDSGFTNAHVLHSIAAVTLLSEMKTQTDAQLININYRLAWEEGHNV